MSDFNLASETPPPMRQGNNVNTCFNFLQSSVAMPSPTFIKSDCSNEQLPATVEVKCQTTTKLTKTQLDPYFLIGCIVFLIVVLTLVVFGGYYLLTRSKRYSTTNSKDRKFLKQCIYGTGVIIFIVILFLFYLIVRN